MEGSLAWLLAAAGKKEEGKKLLGHLMERSSKEQVSPLSIGEAKLALGDRVEGFAWLERAFAERDTVARGLRI